MSSFSAAYRRCRSATVLSVMRLILPSAPVGSTGPRPPRGRRIGSQARAGGVDETSAPKVPAGPDSAAPPRNTMSTGVATSAKVHADAKRRRAVAAKRPGAAIRPSAPKETAGRDSATASAAQPPATTAQYSTSAPKTECVPQRQTAPAQPPGTRPRHPGRNQAAGVWERDRVAAAWTEAAGAGAAPGICCRSINPSVRARRRCRARQSPAVVRRHHRHRHRAKLS